MSPDQPLAIAVASRRDSRSWRQTTITWGEMIGWLDDPADKKECGNYLLGTLSGKRRSNTTIVSRSAITLDADAADGDLDTNVANVLGCAAIVHTTYSSSPDQLKARVIIPTSRELLPDEYAVAATELMATLGKSQFDPSCAEPARYMFKPSAQEPGWFESWVLDGPALDVDELLADWDPDLSTASVPSTSRKRDPFTLEGTIGAFNRVYDDWSDLITTYELPYTAVDNDRWQLTGTASIAGMGPVGPGLVYSHHITDPAYGQACSAFDLVRLHRYADLDDDSDAPVNRRPSHAAMLELASDDPRVRTELLGDDFTEAPDDLDGAFEDAAVWKVDLRVQPRSGKLVDDIKNWDLITHNEPVFTNLYFNELTMAVETSADLPWRLITTGGVVFNSTDRSALCLWLERVYKLRPAREFINELVNTTAARTYRNPLRDYLDALQWDGTPRLETCLPGVEPTAYTRMVARKFMSAAVARIYQPGVKWDHTLVLYGTEGKGKTHWAERMFRGYVATLGRIGDKDTLLTMQRSWAMIADEGHSLRRAEAAVQKEFLTRTEDVFRMPYDREAAVHPRHCVIIGTTDEEVFLRRQEGNRRFLIVRCQHKVDFAAMTTEYVDQVWAEAVASYQAGERLYLTDEESAVSKLERETFTEEDALGGLLEDWLATPIPADWETWSVDARVSWRQSWADGLLPDGEHQITETCSTQLWVEALGHNASSRRPDLLEVTAAMKRIPGWVLLPGRKTLPHYGPQAVFARRDDTTDDLDELL